MQQLTGCGLISIDQRSVIVNVNQAILEWVGADRAEVIGRPLETILTLRMPVAGTDGEIPTDATLHGISGVVRPVVVGSLAAGLPKDKQKQVIFWGTFGAIAVRALMAILVVYIRLAAVVLAAFAIVGISGRPCPRLIGQAERFPYGSVTGWINLRRAERRLVVLEFITVTTCSPPDLRHGRLVQGLQVRIPVCRVQERQQAFDLVGRGLT